MQKIDIFLELSCFFYDPEDVGNLISDSSAFSKTSLNIWNFTVHVLPKPGLENLGITLLVCKLPWWLRRLPGMQETQVQSVGQEDPLEKEIATHSSTLAWRIPWREEPGRRHKLLNHSKETNVRREQRRATQTTRKE